MRETGCRIFLAGGGTGGHLYPGLAIAEAIRRLSPETALAFSSTRRAIDSQVLAGCGCPVTPIDARPFRLAPWKWPSLLVSLVRCGNQSRRRLREFCPDVVVGLGGFGSYAPVRVGQKYGAATVVVNPDIVPGRANRRLACRADRVFCQFQETVDEIGENGRLTGCPVRPSLLGGRRADGIALFGLDPGRRTLLVTGASTGARTVNRAVVAILKSRGLPDGWQALHLTGHGEFDEVSAAYRQMNVAAVVRAYADQMGLAYAAADLVVARAGASTVAELLAVGLPIVFMPYPFHRDQHQMLHARAVERLGAAAVVEDRPQDVEGTCRALAGVLSDLMSNPAELSRMAGKSRVAGRPRAAHEIAREILALADRVTEVRHGSILGGTHPGRPASRDVDNIPPAVYTRTGEQKS